MNIWRKDFVEVGQRWMKMENIYIYVGRGWPLEIVKIPSIEAKDVKIVLEMIFCAVLPMAMFLLVASSRSACRRLWTTAAFSSFMKCNCNKCTTLIFYQGIFLQGGLHWYNGTLQYTGTYRLLMKTIEKNANTVLLDFAVL